MASHGARHWRTVLQVTLFNSSEASPLVMAVIHDSTLHVVNKQRVQKGVNNFFGQR